MHGFSTNANAKSCTARQGAAAGNPQIMPVCIPIHPRPATLAKERQPSILGYPSLGVT